ncbi:MAG: DNA polymerase Y family protein [Azospirillum sp.]|nr:DNA polymerase Y family protein [Azospirillum sp.]
MARRVLALGLPRLATDRVERLRPELRGRLVVACLGSGRGGQSVAAVSQAAAAAGLGPGMTLADARALEPGLVAVAAEPEEDARLLERLAGWCLRYTPWTAADGADGVVLDITGCAHLLGGELPMLADLTNRLSAAGFESGTAIADTPAASWAVARFGPPGTILPAGRQRAVLAGLPVAALRLDPAAAEGLARVGLRRIGDLFELPRAAVTARFGAVVLRRLDQALGLADEPISPHRPVPPHVVRLAFPEPIAGPESIAAALSRLVEGLAAGLLRGGQGVRRLELACYRADDGLDRLPQTIALGTSRAVRDPARLLRLFRDQLERIDPGFGLDVMVLAATAVEPLAAEQAGFAGLAETDGGLLAELVDRLGNRLGSQAVGRLAPRRSWWPERAAAFVPALAAATGDGGETWPADRLRPLRLLDRPEPIEAVAPVPDAPPVLFRWRAEIHRVGRADGPERLLPEWWCPPSGADGRELRDYYRVEDTAGRRFWLYRQGAYHPEHPPKWFLHGFFG